MNCGMIARYMTAALGLSRLVTSPIRNSFNRESRARDCASNSPLPSGRSVADASHAK